MKFKKHFECSESPRKMVVTIYSITGPSNTGLRAKKLCDRIAGEWSAKFKEHVASRGLKLHVTMRPCKIESHCLDVVVYTALHCKFASASDKALFLLGCPEELYRSDLDTV